MMAFAVISADNEWVSGPADAAPALAAGQRVVEVALGYGVTCTWSEVAGGFVDLAPTETPVRFVQLYTPDELAALWSKAMVDGRVAGLFIAAIASPTIDFADPTFTAGIDLSVALGVLTPARAARIKTGLPPVAAQ